VPTVNFTQNIQRHVKCPETRAAGGTVREVLDAVFSKIPLARGYVLDEQGALRKHMVIFLNGAAIHDRTELTDRVAANDEIYIMQALSGG
jgi:molybdopterin synthase sulfur carrier subunit